MNGLARPGQPGFFPDASGEQPPPELDLPTPRGANSIGREMKPLAKILGSLVPTVTVAASAFAAGLPRFEFIGTTPGQDEKGSLVFQVTETSVGRGENLHTIFVVKATVIRSDYQELKEGSEFEGYFDRWYSIFAAPSEHPLKIGDRVEAGIVAIENGRIDGFLKGIRPANQAAEPIGAAGAPPASASGQAAADPPGKAEPDTNAAVVKMEPVTVSADSLMSFGFSIRMIRTDSPRQLVGMYVGHVQKGSDAEKKGLRAGMQIVAIDQRAAESFDPTFASGSELAKIFVGRHDGDSVVLDVVTPGRTKPKRLIIVRRTMIPGLPKIGGMPLD